MTETATTILLVEDDPDIRDLLVEFLGREGFAVQAADGGAAMDRILATGRPDLVILDLMLPGEDGLSICRRLRQGTATTSHLPILMLTAKTAEIDRVVGLELGADDYLGKPFSPRELLARIRAILRRVRAVPAAVPGAAEPPRRRKRVEGVVVDLDARTVDAADGARIALTSAEFDLLGCFLDRPRRVLSRDQLLDWTRGRTHVEPFDRTIDVAVSRLRTRLAQAAPALGARITTVRNVGYLFAGEVEDLG
ncbi:response regulator [Zavarzinia sp. CC-PAN008]|uniref:response regulator n=1 Tax=Zavarzinia sp. CC-PAN008 TaxID=3243332 RepID=UPI003F742FE2